MKRLIRDFAGRKILVLGDVMVDEYIYGETGRISREAPVLILQWRERVLGPGGAANAAQNIQALGGTAIPVGLVGNDENGVALIKLLRSIGVDSDSLIVSNGRATTCKTRIIAGGPHTLRQQVIRIDKSSENPEMAGLDLHALNALKERMAEADAVLVSDYGNGAVSDRAIDYLNRTAGRRTIPVIVDSRSRLNQFRRIDLATPNEEEAKAALGYSGDDMKEWEAVGGKFLARSGNRALLVTRGNAGMILFEKGKKPKKIDIYGGTDVVDTTGAGDTVAAAASLALAAGARCAQAAELANRAGGLAVMKNGAATVSAKELESTYDD